MVTSAENAVVLRFLVVFPDSFPRLDAKTIILMTSEAGGSKELFTTPEHHKETNMLSLKDLDHANNKLNDVRGAKNYLTHMCE